MLYSILSHTAQKAPHHGAVRCGSDLYSYGQLKERVDHFACGLRDLGIRQEEKIAIIHKNCHRFLEIYFAAAKLGAVLVPVNTRLNIRDYVYILNDSQAKILIAQPELVSSLAGKRDELSLLQTVVLTEPDQDASWPNAVHYEQVLQTAVPNPEPPPEVKETDIAQIYYTSGTTGKPKGVILTHKNNAKHTEGCIKELGLCSSDRWLHVSPMFHLADAWAVWAITQAAATHVMIPRFEAKSVMEALQEHDVTLSNFIPTMLNNLVNFPGASQYDFSSLRLVMSGGAPIAKEVVRKVMQIFGCGYIQTYGLTETSPFLTMSILRKEMEHLPFEKRLKYLASTGRPFHGVQIKVVKENGEDVLPDEKEVGEICAKGETITPGYWGLAEETSQRLVDGWLHTRDLAVVNPEGYLTIVDRKDDVIVTGGENVYSIEVENALYCHPAVLEAAVIGLPDPIWGEAVTAVVVPKKREKCCEDELIRFCKEKIASFKAPKKVVFTDSLPKSGPAKISKYKLRAVLVSK
jgi:acyl-CoA synthetase (AMP-forming)/AMP-acid ligase II